MRSPALGTSVAPTWNEPSPPECASRPTKLDVRARRSAYSRNVSEFVRPVSASCRLKTTSAPGWSTGSGRSSRALMTVNTAMLAPMPRASDNTATAANAGLRRTKRNAKPTSATRSSARGLFGLGARHPGRDQRRDLLVKVRADLFLQIAELGAAAKQIAEALHASRSASTC